MLSQIIGQLQKDILAESSHRTDNIQVENSSIDSTERIYYKSLLTISNPATIPPVLQLNLAPVSIDISQYANPFGPTNPNGDYISLYRFSDLANNIPSFNKMYFPSGSKIANIYENVVNGVEIGSNSIFTNAAFASAKQKLINSKLSSLGGTPNSWYPVYANPSDWFNKITQKDNLFPSEIDFSNPVDSFSNQFTVIGNQTDNNLNWNSTNANGSVMEQKLSEGSELNLIKFKFMQVQLNRPWLDFSLFNMGGWYLEGQPSGFISTGNIDENDGILPLYSTILILATDIEIVGNLNTTDTNLVASSIQKDGSINLGPFKINSIENVATDNSHVMKNDGYFILAWVSQLVSLSPKSDK